MNIDPSPAPTAGTVFLVAGRGRRGRHLLYTVLDDDVTARVRVVREEVEIDPSRPGGVTVFSTHRPTWDRAALQRLYATRVF